MKKEDIKKVEINANNGGQVVIVNESGTAYVTQNNLGERSSDIKSNSVKFQNNKKCDYIKAWNSRMFLHQDDDENTLTLADAFIMPNYDKYYYSSKLEILEGETFEQTIECFINCEKTSTLIITGVPGIGKTTIISWIANKYKADDDVIILKFRDWESEELEGGILKAICNILMCKRRDLNNKVLVLDGFDEIKCLNRREHILNEFINDIKDLEKTKIIITSRPTYINWTHFNCSIVLTPFGIEKIKKFYNKIMGIELNENIVDMNKLDVLGVPVILYMAIMSSIDITQNTTKPELYNRIFAEKGGIFDKFCEYDRGSQIMRNHDNTICYLEFLGNTAFNMFEKGKLVLLRSEYKIPELSYHGKSVSVLEFPIKYLFEDTSANIEFIHNSIYEYFVSEYIYNSIFNVLNEDGEIKVKLAGILGRLLKNNRLSFEILDFLKHKIRNAANDKFDIVNKVFQLMLKDGMTYFVNGNQKNILQCEMCIFTNMLNILHLQKNNYLKYDELIRGYLNCNMGFKINLENADLRGVNLINMDLRGLNLENANLTDTDLRKICLDSTNLKNAKLDGANLCSSSLKETYLINASIVFADLSDSDIRLAKISNADLRNVNLTGSDLRSADLSKSNLSGAWLNAVRLGGVDLKGADLSNTEIRGADLEGTDLEKANLQGADLTCTNLVGANFAEVDLTDAILEGSIWQEDSFFSVFSQLRQTNFTYILLERESERRKVFRNKLFS